MYRAQESEDSIRVSEQPITRNPLSRLCKNYLISSPRRKYLPLSFSLFLWSQSKSKKKEKKKLVVIPVYLKNWLKQNSLSRLGSDSYFFPSQYNLHPFFFHYFLWQSKRNSRFSNKQTLLVYSWDSGNFTSHSFLVTIIKRWMIFDQVRDTTRLGSGAVATDWLLLNEQYQTDSRP